MTDKTVLLTLGRLPVVLDIARSFCETGWRVLVAEPTRMHLARMSNAVGKCYRVRAPVDDPAGYLDDLLKVIDAERVDLVVPVSEESVHVAGLGPRLGERTMLFCGSRQQLLSLHDKYRFNRLAAERGLPVPATALAGDPGADAIAAGGRFVTKPRFSSSGRQVGIHEAGADIDARTGSLVQAWIPGDELSFFGIVHDGDIVAGLTYRGTVTDGSVAVCFERVTETAPVHSWCARFLAEQRYTGMIGFDFIVADDGSVMALECNPRATSGLHYLSRRALAPLILGEKPANDVFRAETHLVESYSCFTTVFGALPSLRAAGTRLRALRRARDVSYLRSDPWPFLLMMVNTYRLIALALLRGYSFAQAAVLDIEWRPRDAAGTADAAAD